MQEVVSSHESSFKQLRFAWEISASQTDGKTRESNESTEWIPVIDIGENREDRSPTAPLYWSITLSNSRTQQDIIKKYLFFFF